MSDVFRKEYRPLSDETKEKVLSIKSKAQDLYNEIVSVKGDARMIALAITKLEESAMWAIKSIT